MHNIMVALPYLLRVFLKVQCIDGPLHRPWGRGEASAFGVERVYEVEQGGHEGRPETDEARYYFIGLEKPG